MFIKIRLADVEGAKKVLPNYFEILNGHKSASYLKCKNVPIEIDLGVPEDRLWEEHDRALAALKNEDFAEELRVSLLDLKLKLARQMLFSCELCERKCATNRMKGKAGHCGVIQSKISTEFLHWGEEPELVPSHTIFFAGCTFNCVFCQNWDISQNPKSGNIMPTRRIADVIDRRSETARNVNWVGGDPTSNLPFIMEVLTLIDANIPQVWNSNLYLSEKTMKLLEGVIDLYLSDFKYGNNECAERLSNVKNYWEIITRNHKTARAQSEMIIRHLVLPGHFECCTKPVLEWIAKNLKAVRVNVMDQYRPEYNAYEFEELTRRLDGKEFMRAKNFALDLGLSLTD